MKVLVVDDNILDRKYIKYLLENNLGIKPETAKDGLEALNKIKSNHFDIVITDIVMPKIEGIELIEQIKVISPKTKIIAVSGSNPYYLYILSKMGINDTYTKPIDTHLFLENVKNIKLSLKNHLSQA